MRAPGDLGELEADGAEAWNRAVAAVAEGLVKGGLWSPHLTEDTALTPELRAPDWPAFPARIEACLDWQRAFELLDWRPDGEGDVGRIRHQEEYLEWRVIREDGKPRRIEMTTELREYWQVLAAYQPERTLALVADFAGKDEVPIAEIYGSTDPFDAAVGPKERLEAFTRAMLPSFDGDGDSRAALAGVSAYNDGTKAICCLIHPFNRLLDLLRLVSTSAHPFLVTDSVSGRIRFPSGSEAIVGVKPVAEDGRNSDPLLVERIVQFATEGRWIGFDDPVGIYIRDFQHHELALPNGDPPPTDWFEPGGDRAAISFSRGLGPQATDDGRPRYQRLTLELPPGADLLLGDLVVRRTGEKISFGGQLAALTQLAVYVRTGPCKQLASIEPQTPANGELDCQGVLASWEEAQSTEGFQ